MVQESKSYANEDEVEWREMTQKAVLLLLYFD